MKPNESAKIIKTLSEVEKGAVGIAKLILETDKKVDNAIESTDSKIAEIKSIAENTAKQKGEKGDRGEKGDKGERGEQGVKGKDGKDGKNGKDGKDGDNGKNGKDGVNGIEGKDGKDGSPDTGEQIVDKINKQDTKIDRSKIKDLDKDIKELKERQPVINNIIQGQGGASGIRDIRAGSNITVSKVNEVYTISSAGGVDTDEKVKVSANDTTAGYLNGKLVAGSGITLTENNDGGNETLTVAFDNTGGYITGATDSTLTETGDTLGINLGNSNTWSVMQGFNDGTGNSAYLANTAGSVGGSFTGVGIGGTFGTSDNAYSVNLASNSDFAAGYFADNNNFTYVFLGTASYAVDGGGVINTSSDYYIGGSPINVSHWSNDAGYLSGTVQIGNGGTGATSFGANRIPYINSGNTAFTSASTFVFTGTNLGIGTASPAQKLDIQSGALRFSVVTAPSSAPTAALAGAGAGNLSNGTYRYIVTYVNALGQTQASTYSNTITVVNNATNGRVSLTGIPVSSDATVTARNIFRSQVGNVNMYYLATISDNTTTTYTDNIADASLGYYINVSTAEYTQDCLQNTTSGKMFIGSGLLYHETGISNNLYFGRSTGNSTSTNLANSNTAFGMSSLRAITNGNNNVAVGANCLGSVTNGSGNIGLGAGVMYTLVSGSSNMAIGNAALALTTSSDNVAVGAQAGDTNSSGTGNTYIGRNADANAGGYDYATAIGHSAVVQGSYSMALGVGATAGAANTCAIGGTGANAINTVFGGTTASAKLHVINTTASTVGMIVQAAASQSVELQQWRNSSGTVIGEIENFTNPNGSGLLRVGTGTNYGNYQERAILGYYNPPDSAAGWDRNQAVIEAVLDVTNASTAFNTYGGFAMWYRATKQGAGYVENISGAGGQVEIYSGSGNVGSAFGFYSVYQNASTNTVSEVFGTRSYVGPSAANTTSSFYGSQIFFGNSGSSNMTTIYGYHLRNVMGTVGTNTNMYGFYMQDFTAKVTNTWGMYILGATTNNYLQGNLGIGIATPSSKFHIQDSSNPSVTITSGAYASGKDAMFLGVVTSGNAFMNGTSAGDSAIVAKAGGALHFGVSSSTGTTQGQALVITAAGGFTQSVNDALFFRNGYDYFGRTITTGRTYYSSNGSTYYTAIHTGGDGTTGTWNVGRTATNPQTATSTPTAILTVSDNQRVGINTSTPSSAFHVVGDFELDGALNHDGTTVGFYGVTPVVQSSAYTTSNVTTDRTYDADATTVNELADVVGTLIADLKATGIIG